MAVEILFLSVVLRKEALAGLQSLAYQTALRLFQWEPDWFREDEHMLATTFMSPFDTRRFGKALEARIGLQRGRDWGVVDMATGPTHRLPWLEWRDACHGNSLAWNSRMNPGEVVRVPAMVPGGHSDIAREAKVCKLFGRDSGHDAYNHRDDFGRFLPAWGGRDLWLFSDPDADPDDPMRWVSVNLNPIDFSAY